MDIPVIGDTAAVTRFPAGHAAEDAICATRLGVGPGTPCYRDAASGLADALTILDFAPTQDVRRAAALEAVLAPARPKDAFTLWHLLSHRTPDERQQVYDGLASLVPPHRVNA